MAKLNLTPKDFAPHVLAVIGEMTDLTPGVVVAMERAYGPVCARMNIDPDEFGIAAGKTLPVVHRKIQLAMRQLRDNGLTEYPVRGQWSLTERGRATLTEMGDLEEAEHVEHVFVAAREETEHAQEEMAPREESNVVRINTGRHPYSDDPYIRGLAIERTACFSAFSSRSEVCRACPLQRDCIAAAGVTKAEIGAELLREAEEARRLEAERQAKKVRQNASIDELMASQETEARRQPAGKTTSGDKFKPTAEHKVNDATAQKEGLCAKCQGTVPEGSACYWVESIGIFHPNCIETPLP
jgi:hypothetical protein